MILNIEKADKLLIDYQKLPVFYLRLKLQTVILKDQKLEISEGDGLFEVFERGKKTSPSLRHPLLKSRGLLFSCINKI